MCRFIFPLLMALSLFAQGARQSALRQMSDSLEALARKVSPAVVKIEATGYRAIEEGGHQNAAVVSRQLSVGSGVIIDAGGYIVTNAHVIEGAQRIRVLLSGAGAEPAKSRILTATIAGADRNTDLAVLKVERTGLPTLPLADYDKVHQGQLVLAFGSPQGLENTVTMGVVSSVMRQPDPDRPMMYIQTDAPVNPGNSGGPLVDAEGGLVGINTFILSESGGSEGIGFAIPSVIVHYVYRELLEHGHVHRRSIAAALQAITPPLAGALGLSHDQGLIVSDVLPGGPSEKAGLRIQDELLTMDSVRVDNIPMLAVALYRKSHGDEIALQVQRGSEKLTLKIPIQEIQQQAFDDLSGLVNPEKSLVRGLGIMGLEISDNVLEFLPELRIRSGVLVAARAADARVQTGLQPGDVIHYLNRSAVESLDGLRSALGQLKTGDPAALQLERGGKLMYLAFEIE